MRTSKPRVEPVAVEDLTDEQREAAAPVLAAGPFLNVYATLVRAPKAFARYSQWGAYVLSRRNSLSPREREILILRVGFLCKSGYEFTQHTALGLRAGLSNEEIAAIKQGAGAGNWTSAEQALICAADELVRDFFVSDATWAALGQHFDEKQCMDVVFTVGQYTQTSMFLNSFGVQLEPGAVLDPDLKA